MARSRAHTIYVYIEGMAILCVLAVVVPMTIMMAAMAAMVVVVVLKKGMLLLLLLLNMFAFEAIRSAIRCLMPVLVPRLYNI